jgi:DNA-binding NtrC family response regulator
MIMAEKLIFIVDDEENLRRLMEHVLSSWGYKVNGFGDVETCLENMNHSPDLIILDINLPGMSGDEMLKQLAHRDDELPVIMVSAQGQIGLAVETIKLGAVDYFTKPIDFPKLNLAVRNALRSHELVREMQLPTEF